MESITNAQQAQQTYQVIAAIGGLAMLAVIFTTFAAIAYHKISSRDYLDMPEPNMDEDDILDDVCIFSSIDEDVIDAVNQQEDTSYEYSSSDGPDGS